MLKNEFSGKRVTVFGLNRSGLAVAKLLDALGAVVTVTDSRGPDALSSEIAALKGVAGYGRAGTRHCSYEFHLGGHREECIAHADYIVVSPGVPLDIPILCEAQARNIPILAELEVAARVCSAPIVAITGTKGKSTTTLLTAAILKASRPPGSRVCVAGNIGVPLSAEVQHLTSRDIVVVEASSFQLEGTVTFQPAVSVVLNLSRDHLDRHRTMSAYCKAKQKIYQNQTAADWIVLNCSDARVARFAEFTSAKAVYFDGDGTRSVPATFNQGRGLFSNLFDGDDTRSVPATLQWICDVDDLPLRGAHNVRNVLAAIAVGQIFEVTPAQMRAALQGFDRSHPALAHAFEPVRMLNGIEFINDSKATNVAAVKAALESLAGDGNPRGVPATLQRRILLIMGGYDKGNDYTPLSQMVQAHVKGAVLLGAHTQQIQKTLAKLTNIFNTSTMAEAVQVAYTHATPGDIVLLSPANASFDMYPNYKARGAAFKEAVNALES